MNLAILRVIGLILFLYLSWRNLRDNYKEENLIVYSWVAVLGLLIGGRLAFGLINFGVWNQNWWDWFSVWSKPGMSILGAYLSLVGVTFLMSRLEGWKLWPFLEDLSNNILILFLFIMLDEWVRSHFSLSVGVYSLIIFLGLGVNILVKSRYRSWVWYHSGKKGFVFFFTNAIMFFMLSLTSWWFKSSIWVTGIFALLSFMSGVSLLILGEVFEPLVLNVKRSKNEKAKE
jgi:hypothetical protein